MLQPVSAQLQDGLCFLQPPIPAPLSVGLTTALPSGARRRNGLTSFRVFAPWVT